MIKMRPFFQSQTLKTLFRRKVLRKFGLKIPFEHRNCHSFPPLNRAQTTCFLHTIADSGTITEFQSSPGRQSAIELQNVLMNNRDGSVEEIGLALGPCSIEVTEDLVMDVLERNSSDWKLAYAFFKWVWRRSGDSLGVGVYNRVIDILGKMQRFHELTQVLDEMSKREGFANDSTFGILLNRYAAANKLEEAISFFHRRKEFGLENDLVAFQMLLMHLCRHKHVGVAENLFYSKKREFGFDIKTMNIVLNGWCVLGNVHEAKRFWKDIIASKVKPDLFTYGIFIKALTNKGKLGLAMKLFRGMWEKGCHPDVVISNCIINALCFKKRFPEALQVFREMSERGCLPNVATYNSLIKYLCKIRRMENVLEMLIEMEEKGGSCLPNDITFSYLLKSLKGPEEIPGVLMRMERNGCKMSADTYNLILKLYMDWDHQEGVKSTWDEMEKSGLGVPDRRSYTIMIHGLHDKGRIEEALSYFNVMTTKGMVPEPRTEVLVNSMKIKLIEQEGGEGKKDATENVKRKRKKRMKVDSR